MNRFLSTKNTFTVSILWAVVLLLLLLLFIGIKQGQIQLVAIIILSLVISLIIWILLDTRYVIKSHFLLYRSGPFRGRLNIDKIQKIKYYSGLYVPVTMKPALDTIGYIISNDGFEDVYVSPKNSTTFIEELLKINPKIEIL
jgi:Bacterial PH domain